MVISNTSSRPFRKRDVGDVTFWMREQAVAIDIDGAAIAGDLTLPADTRGLVVFAHGYVAFNQPLNFYHLTLPDGTSIPGLVESPGFAFATTSYRKNGLAVLEGVEDVKELVQAFQATRSVPLRRA